MSSKPYFKAQATKRKISINDSRGDRLRPGEYESEGLRLVATKSKWEKGSD